MIELYTTENCNYCTKAKNVLNSLKVEYKSYTVGKEVSRDFIMGKFPNAKSYPVVVVNGEYIGGYNELEMRVYEDRNNFGKTLLVES
jgi:glutaredoxin